MKCECCGHEVEGMNAMPDLEAKVYMDWTNQQVASCIWCHELIYRTPDDTNWLHLATDRRRCGEGDG